MLPKKMWSIIIYSLFFFHMNWNPVSSRNLHKNCVLNDNYCDCGDDEPQTNACSLYSSGRQFQCTDLRYFNQTIYMSKVGDRVCDCCDGSDETIIECPNICKQLGKDLATEESLRKLERVKGVTERSIILKNSRAQLHELRSGMRNAVKTIAENEKLLALYKEDLLQQEKIERIEFEKVLQKSTDIFLSTLHLFSIDSLQKLLAVITILTKEEGVEAILVECDDKYELDGLDPTDSTAFALVAENVQKNKGDLPPTCPITGKNTQAISEDSVQAMITALSLQRLTMNSLVDVSQYAIARALESGSTLADCFLRIGITIPSTVSLENFPISPITLQTRGPKKVEAEILRGEISRLSGQIVTLRDNANAGQKLKNIDFGPNEIFYSLFEKCFSLKQKEYTYEICMFKNAKQQQTLIGKFEKYEVLASEKISLERVDGINLNVENEKSFYFLFKNGETCWNTQKPRELRLQLVCSTGEERITDFSEPNICSYSAILLTPLVCGTI